jgi:hypothetical protein
MERSYLSSPPTSPAQYLASRGRVGYSARQAQGMPRWLAVKKSRDEEVAHALTLLRKPSGFEGLGSLLE